jgi:hypothetical protein
MATLTVTHTETLILNGREIGSNNTFNITDLSNAYTRIFSVPANQDTSLVIFDDLSETSIEGSNDGASPGALEVDTVKYLRITNLDSSNAINLCFTLRTTGNDSEAAGAISSVQVPAGQSYILGGALTTLGVDDDSGAAAFNFQMIEEIVADSGSNTIDVELFIANT